MDDEQLRLASDPATPADALRALARASIHHRGSRFRRAPEPIKALQLALVQNPSTPFDVLVELTSYNTVALRLLPENPSFALHLLTNPTFLQRFDVGGLLALATSLNAPPPLLSSCFERALRSQGGPDPLLVRTLISHPSMPPGDLAHAAGHRQPWIRACAAENPSTPPDTLARFVRLGSSPDLRSTQPPASDLTADELLDAPRLGDWGAALAAAHPASPPSLLERLASHSDPAVLVALAANPSSPHPLLLRLLQRNRGLVQPSLSSNPAAPPELLAQLAWAPQNALPLLDNPSTPPEALRILAGSVDPLVRARAAQHPGLPPAFRSLLLSAGFDPLLSAPPATLPDEADLIALLDGGPWFHDIFLARMPLPPAAQQRLARSRFTTARRKLASSPDLHPSTALLLARDSDGPTVCALLQRSPLDESIVQAILQGNPRRDALEALASHPAAPPHLLEALVGRLPALVLLRLVPEPSLALLVRIQESGATHAIVEFLHSPRATLEHREHFASHPDWMLRRACGRGATVPLSLLERLAADSHVGVRAMVAWERAKRGLPPM